MGWLDEIFAAPVEALVDPDAQVCLSGAEVRRWGLGERDTWSLTSLGLPLIEVLQFIPEPEPGGLRRFGDREGYHLGLQMRLDVCLLPGSWHVVGIADDDRGRSYTFINSSPTAYVECSWRYYRFGQKMDELPFTLESYDVLEALLARLVAIDPAIGTDSSVSFWPEVIEDW